MNATDLIDVRALCDRLHLTERRVAFLIKTKVLIPDVVTADDMFWHRHNLWSIRQTVEKFSGI